MSPSLGRAPAACTHPGNLTPVPHCEHPNFLDGQEGARWEPQCPLKLSAHHHSGQMALRLKSGGPFQPTQGSGRSRAWGNPGDVHSKVSSHIECSKSEKEKYPMTLLKKKKGTNELIYKTEIESQT